MLTDAKEIEIISAARQKNVANPNRSRVPFERIFDTFLKETSFNKKLCFDIGPGHFDFGEMVRERGGDVIALDNDPAVVTLGRHKGYTCIEGDIRDLATLQLPDKLDGIICKFSISCFWFENAAAQAALVETLVQHLAEDGWIWIAPWNGAHGELSDSETERMLADQITAFSEMGFSSWELSETAARYFGVHGHVANNPLFVRNLNMPEDAAMMRPLGAAAPFGAGKPFPEPSPGSDLLRASGKRGASARSKKGKISRLLESLFGNSQGKS